MCAVCGVVCGVSCGVWCGRQNESTVVALLIMSGLVIIAAIVSIAWISRAAQWLLGRKWLLYRLYMLYKGRTNMGPRSRKTEGAMVRSTGRAHCRDTTMTAREEVPVLPTKIEAECV